jgi:protein-S-isoprenylcysteine O-methyltransferase Ste14
MLLAGLWTMVADFLAVAEDHVDRARNADTVGEAVAETNRSARQFATQAPFMQKMRVIGAAAITIVLIIVVLSMLYNMDIVQNANGPFADLIDEYVGYIGAALTLIGMGLIAYAANTVMGAFGGGGMGGGR